ncbi:MAG: hypothetical protein ABTQ25_19800, partial [Nitrosomonas ureae]
HTRGEGGVMWRYHYNCRWCDECFPCGAQESDEAYATKEQALAAAKEYVGDAPWDYWAVEAQP